MRKRLLLFITILVTTTLWAHDFKSGDLCYNITSSESPYTVEVTINDTEDNYANITTITIPEVVTNSNITYNVTGIGNRAFWYCKSLISITIPNSVTRIGDYAFSECSSLSSITIPNSVKSLGNLAFYYCPSLTSVTIGDGLQCIGEKVFADCKSLNIIKVSDGNIHYDSRENCNAIVETATNALVQGCQNTIIPNSVTSIGKDAFYRCEYLNKIIIPNSVMHIGREAFYHCESLNDITIGNGVISIEADAFSYTKLYNTYSAWENEVLYIGNYLIEAKTSIADSYVIKDGTLLIGNYAFKDCDNLTSIIMPESVLYIGRSAFADCTSLNSVLIPNTLTSIGESAFSRCGHLTLFAIPNNIEYIGDYAFIACESITSIHLPNTLKNIGENAFYGCTMAQDSCINLSIFSSEENNYWGATIVDIEREGLLIKNDTIIDCRLYVTHVDIPNYVTCIGTGAFQSCQSLKTVNIPNSITSIGRSAFNSCTSLATITIPNTIINIPDMTFYNCKSLTSISIPNSVTSIGGDAFEYCSSLSSITIPNSVTSINERAFSACTSLSSITCHATTPPTIYGSYVFSGVSKSIPVYVPCGYVENYKSAEKWKGFTNIQEPLAEYSIEVYVNDTIMGSAKVDYNTFCEGAQISITPNIGYHFLQWNDGNADTIRTLALTRDTILTAEFEQSFSGQCGNNLYWSYDESAKTISITGSGKMYDYTVDTQPWLLFKEQIVELTTSNTVTSIGTSAFEGCVRLGKISLGTGLEEIAVNAFAGCTRLYDIYVYAAYPPFANESSFANYNVYLYVPCESIRNYTLDVVWGNFKFLECIESENVTTEGVVVTPSTNDVTITWPTETGADSYTIVIKKGDTVFCTLTFNAAGQLLNIAFAPGRDGNHPAQYAEQAGNGYRFTVTGLDEGTHYAYNIDVRDAANKTIKSHTGEFTTESMTAVEDVEFSENANAQKIFRDQQILILRDGVEYTIMGQEL